MTAPQHYGAAITRSGGLQVHGARATPAVVLEIVGHTLLAIQGTHARGLNRTDVHERIAASVFGLDEAIALVGVEELYGSSNHFDVPSMADRQSARRR